MYAYKLRRDEDYVPPPPAQLRSIDGSDHVFEPVDSAARQLQMMLADRMQGGMAVAMPAPVLSVRARLALIAAICVTLWVMIAGGFVALIG